MPRERQDFFRLSNTTEREKIVILAFEGNVTEEEYFEEFKNTSFFKDELIYLLILKRPRNDTNSAPKHVFGKLKRETKDEFAFDINDELWMIIDTDRWKNIPEIVEECNKQQNMYVAVSNPSFEFGLLLHIKNINEYTAGELNSILENKKVTKDRTYVNSKILDILGSYNKSNPLPERFLPNVSLAITQAKLLDSNNEDFPTKLGSHVYKIVEKFVK